MKRLVRGIIRRVRGNGVNRVNKLDFNATYSNLVKSLKNSHETDRAMELAVGGDFKPFGALELETLKHFGLKEDSYVIDVGCGSGRLAKPLSSYLKGPYLGIDIVPELVEHAKTIVGRPDWRFAVAEGLRIPEKDGVADFVCFFSVFTHLLLEQTYVYLQEAKRVLKPGGRVVFSFVDLSVPDHWQVFEFTVADLEVNSQPLNMFFGEDAIRAWARHLELDVHAIQRGDEPYVPLTEPIVFESGAVIENLGTLGQSVGVLQKK